MKIRKKVQVSLKESFEELIHNIKGIPGNKVLTLAYHGGTFEVEMEESGRLELPQSEETLFFARMADALREGGGLIIRQILPTQVEITSPNRTKADHSANEALRDRNGEENLETDVERGYPGGQMQGS